MSTSLPSPVPGIPQGAPERDTQCWDCGEPVGDDAVTWGDYDIRNGVEVDIERVAHPSCHEAWLESRRGQAAAHITEWLSRPVAVLQQGSE